MTAQMLGNVAARLRRHGRGWRPLAFALLGAAGGVFWPGFNAMIGAVVPSAHPAALLRRQLHPGQPRHRPRRAARPASSSTCDRPGTFLAVYLGNAASFLAPLAVLLGPLRHVTGKVEAPPARTTTGRRPGRRLPHAPARRRAAPGAAADVPVGVRRLRPDGGRLHGLRPPRRPGLDPAPSALAFAVNTAVIVAAAAVRAAADRGPPAHPGDPRPLRHLGRCRGPASASPGWSPARSPRPRSSSPAPASSAWARRSCSRRSRRSPTTCHPTTCAVATTRSWPQPSRVRPSPDRRWPGCCIGAGWHAGFIGLLLLGCAAMAWIAAADRAPHPRTPTAPRQAGRCRHALTQPARPRAARRRGRADPRRVRRRRCPRGPRTPGPGPAR